MTEKQEQATQKKPTTVAGYLFEYVEMFVFAALAVILLMTFGLRLCVVSGSSMDVTLLNGERLVVSNLFYTPQKGDIIVFHQTSDTDDGFNEPIVKRVIAKGGEHVKIDYTQKKIYVSADNVFTEDELLIEPYIMGFTPNYSVDSVSFYDVPEGHLFVLGDNRFVSADSRYHEVGFVDERRVLGKVLLRLTPFSKFGIVG